MNWKSERRERPEHQCLPGAPKARLVKSVRRHLRHYRITPHRWDDDWHLAWRWAHQIGASYVHFHWPGVAEIGAQYLLLVLARMKADRQLRLPLRASSQAPAAVQARLSGQSLFAIAFQEKT